MSKSIIPREYLGAFKKGHRKSAREFIDDELSYTLLERAEAGCEESRKALQWIAQFNNEYYKNVIGRNDGQAFHRAQVIPNEFDKKGRPLTFKKECEKREYDMKNDAFLFSDKSKKQGDDF